MAVIQYVLQSSTLIKYEEFILFEQLFSMKSFIESLCFIWISDHELKLHERYPLDVKLQYKYFEELKSKLFFIGSQALEQSFIFNESDLCTQFFKLFSTQFEVLIRSSQSLEELQLFFIQFFILIRLLEPPPFFKSISL